MRRRRVLIVAAAGLTTACGTPAAGPATLSTRTISTTPPPPPPTSTAVPAPSPAPSPTAAALPTRSTASPTSTPGSVPATAPALPQASEEGDVALDVRLWNGHAEVQLDGGTIQPGVRRVPRGDHQLAALVDGDVVALVDAPADGGAVDLVVPPPRASLAVMIENQANARPQSGLTGADVVYEALAEGGITRFIAVYVSGDAPVVGPVRSLRHYFAFLAADYGADVVHIGASPEGFTWRDAMNMGHLDESAGDPGVWRVGYRSPPHNAYTNTSMDRAYLQQFGRQQGRQWGPLLFDAQAPRGDEPASQVGLRFHPWTYRVEYEWDPEQSRYLRFMEGAPHLDADSGEQIAPATVVVQFAEVEAIPNDPKLRLDVNLVGGSGPLVIFSNGTRREGFWSKGAPTDPSIWLDTGGEPLVIPPGPVWVELAPLDSPLSVVA